MRVSMTVKQNDVSDVQKIGVYTLIVNPEQVNLERRSYVLLFRKKVWGNKFCVIEE